MKSELRALKEREAKKVLVGLIIRWAIVVSIIIGLFIIGLAIWYYCTTLDILHFVVSYLMFGLLADCVIISFGKKWTRSYTNKMSNIIKTKVEIYKLRTR